MYLSTCVIYLWRLKCFSFPSNKQKNWSKIRYRRNQLISQRKSHKRKRNQSDLFMSSLYLRTEIVLINIFTDILAFNGPRDLWVFRKDKKHLYQCMKIQIICNCDQTFCFPSKVYVLCYIIKKKNVYIKLIFKLKIWKFISLKRDL